MNTPKQQSTLRVPETKTQPGTGLTNSEAQTGSSKASQEPQSTKPAKPNASTASRMAQLKEMRQAREEGGEHGKSSDKGDNLQTASGNDTGTTGEEGAKSSTDPEKRATEGDQAGSGGGNAQDAQNGTETGGNETGETQGAQDGGDFEPVRVTEIADALGLPASDLYDLPIDLGEGSGAKLGDVLKSYQSQEALEARETQAREFEFNIKQDIDLAMMVRDEIGGAWSQTLQQHLQQRQVRNHQMNVQAMHRLFPDMATREGMEKYASDVVAISKEFGIAPERASAPESWQEVGVWREIIANRAKLAQKDQEIADLRNAAKSQERAKARRSPPKIRQPGKNGSVDRLAADKSRALSGDKAAKSRYMKAFRDRKARQ